MRANSADAVSTTTPGRRRPRTVNGRRLRSALAGATEEEEGDSAGSTASGTQSLVSRNIPAGPPNRSAATPTISNGWPDSRTIFPTTCGSEANRDCHSQWLSTVTRAAARSPSAWMVRPMSAVASSVGKYKPSTAYGDGDQRALVDADARTLYTPDRRAEGRCARDVPIGVVHKLSTNASGEQ
jgi:hypothetical protein